MLDRELVAAALNGYQPRFKNKQGPHR